MHWLCQIALTLYFVSYFAVAKGKLGTRSKLECSEPDVCRNASELITTKGYPCEEYTVQTKDGFLLTVQRIPHGKTQKGSNVANKPAVFLQHGLLGASTDWLTNLENESFAYMLADAGYDVWLGNVRGNTYSRRHIKYQPKDKEFWAWSWDEMAEYDLPAMIDYVLAETGQKNIYYVGFSQGTLIAFAQLARHQEFAQKIKTFFALGPVITTGNIKSPVKYLRYIANDLQDLFSLLGIYEFMPSNAIMKILASTVCDNEEIRVFCEDVIFIFAGFDESQLNVSRLPVYIGHDPAGTSVQNMVHFAQTTDSGLFQMFNYGSPEKNKQHYHQATPPLYNASKVLAPVALFSAENDWLADPKDVSLLASQLPNLTYFEHIPKWDHLDFIWAMDANKVVYQKVMAMMQKYEGTTDP